MLLTYSHTHTQCSYTSDEIHFNLMAIVSDRKLQLEKEIASCESQRDMAAQRVRDKKFEINFYGLSFEAFAGGDDSI